MAKHIRLGVSSRTFLTLRFGGKSNQTFAIRRIQTSSDRDQVAAQQEK